MRCSPAESTCLLWVTYKCQIVVKASSCISVLFGLNCLTCLAWATLPGDEAPTTIAVRVIGHKVPNYDKAPVLTGQAQCCMVFLDLENITSC